MNGDRLHLPTLLCSASICGAILATAGCSNANSAAPSVAIASPSVPDTTAASPTAAATFYGFEDPRCTPSERQAIRAAAMAVIGTTTPSAAMLKGIRYMVATNDKGWIVEVWQLPATPGGYTNVFLNADFTVQTVMGGE